MTAHLLVPALDSDRPATMSTSVLVDLLRVRLGFTGLVVTDAIEMASVAQRYGLARAGALAVAAGADAICIGGENYDEQTAIDVRDAIVDGVLDGTISEERLVEAAQRVADFAIVSAATRSVRKAAGDTWPAAGTTIGLAAARRALRITGSVRLTGPAHVVEFTTGTNLAIEPRTPWGLGAPLRALRPDTTVVRLAQGATAADVLAGADGRIPVLVCRDPHRHPWLAALLAKVIAIRPESIVVEMGVTSGDPIGAAHLATYGAATVCGTAAAEALVSGGG